MFKLTRAKYIAALDSAEKLEKTLTKENENLRISSVVLSGNWQGNQAEQNLGTIGMSLEHEYHAKTQAYAQGMILIMDGYQTKIEQMMAKREQIGEQLKQDEYVPPNLSYFQEENLIINYDYIDNVKADVEGALLRGDAAIDILEEMIDDVTECAGEYVNLTEVLNLFDEGTKKLHRLENYRDEFADFGNQMSDLEYNMSYDFSCIMQAQGDTNLLNNPMEITTLNLSGRAIQMENEGEWYYERTKSILEQDSSQWTPDDISFLEEALSEAWNSKDYDTTEQIMDTLSGQTSQNRIAAFMNCQSIQDNKELYYTLNRVNQYNADYTDIINADNTCPNYHIEEINDEIRVTLNLTVDKWTDSEKEIELYNFTATNLNSIVSKHALEQKGYTDNEIEAFMLSIKTDEDAELAANLSKGNYREAYSTDYEKLGKCMVYQLSLYQSIMATRLTEEEYLKETEKQINVLLSNTDENNGIEKSCVHKEYISLINNGLKTQNSMYDTLEENSMELTARDKQVVKRTQMISDLWSTFDTQYTGIDSVEQPSTALPGTGKNTCNVHIINLRKNDNTNSYCYDVELVYNGIGDKKSKNIVHVDVEEFLAAHTQEAQEEEIDGHDILDLAGLIPLAGAAFDLINTIWYLSEGNIPYAVLSGASFIPIYGEYVGAGKIGVKATTKILKHTDDVVDIATGTGKYLDDVIEDGVKVVDEISESALKGGADLVKFNIDEIRPQLKTEPDTAFFWSGKTDGVGGAEVAADIAKGKGGVTLESTIEAKDITMPEWDFNDPSSMDAWDMASAAYAEQVSGEVRAVVGTELRPDNIWENVELPRLMENPNVTKITIIDPKTGIETIIFER